MHLFLLSVSLLSLGLSTLLTGTLVAGLGTLFTEQTVCVLGGLVVLDGTLLEGDGVLDGENLLGGLDGVALLGGLDLLDGSVTLLGLAVAAGEENEALPVLLETLHVGLEALLGEVLAAGVDGDTDGASELAGDTGGYLHISCGFFGLAQKSYAYPSTQ